MHYSENIIKKQITAGETINDVIASANKKRHAPL